MKRLRDGLLGVTGIVALLPGMALFISDIPVPPGARVYFAVALEAAAALVVGGVLVRARSTQHETGVGKKVTMAGIFGLIALAAYWSLSTTAVRAVAYDAQRPDTVLIPIFPSYWARPIVDSLVACAQVAPAPCSDIPPAQSYSASDVVAAMHIYSADAIEPHISDAGRNATRLLLLLLAVAVPVTLAFALTSLVLQVPVDG